MIRKNLTLGMLLCALSLYPLPLLVAQRVSQPSQPVSSTPSTSTESNTIFVQGIVEVPLRLDQQVSSATAHKGDRIRFTLLKGLSCDGKLMASAGSTFYATVSHVQPKNRHHSGVVRFSDATLDLVNGQRLRLSESDSEDNIGPEAIPVVILAGVTLVPITVALLPIQLPYLLIHHIREQRHGDKTHTTRPEPVDIELPEGEVLIYYADTTPTTKL